MVRPTWFFVVVLALPSVSATSGGSVSPAARTFILVWALCLGVGAFLYAFGQWAARPRDQPASTSPQSAPVVTSVEEFVERRAAAATRELWRRWVPFPPGTSNLAPLSNAWQEAMPAAPKGGPAGAVPTVESQPSEEGMAREVFRQLLRDSEGRSPQAGRGRPVESGSIRPR